MRRKKREAHKPFADLHCHPAELIYHRQRIALSQDEFIRDVNRHPLNQSVIKDNCAKLVKGKMAGPYLQSDFYKCSVAEYCLVFAALYPLEMGFVKGRFRPGRLVATLLSKVPLLNLLISYFNIKTLNLPAARYRYMRGGSYDYFDELETVYRYYLKKSEQEFDGETLVDCGPPESTKGVYKVLKNKEDLRSLPHSFVEGEDHHRVVGVIFTIEGMHSFGLGHIDASHDRNVQWDILQKRILQWKQSPHPIFFVTFSHHFSNGLCGHAHSFPRIVGSLLLDQDIDLGGGFTPMGRKALDLLLNIGHFNTVLGRRILVDVKHMSPSGREELYHILDEHHETHPSDRIPIIASHMGFSGHDRLAEVKHIGGKEIRRHEKDNSAKHGFEIDGLLYHFNPWGINLTREDVEEIVFSKGLIGISMDERITAAKKTRRVLKRKFRSTAAKQKLFQNIILNNILGIVHASYASKMSMDDKDWVWSSLCLGSDYDGYINPLDSYSAVVSYDQLRKDLVKTILEYHQNHPEGLFSRLEAAKLHTDGDDDFITSWVSRFMFENAYNFALTHFPA